MEYDFTATWKTPPALTRIELAWNIHDTATLATGLQKLAILEIRFLVFRHPRGISQLYSTIFSSLCLVLCPLPSTHIFTPFSGRIIDARSRWTTSRTILYHGIRQLSRTHPHSGLPSVSCDGVPMWRPNLGNCLLEHARALGQFQSRNPYGEKWEK